ncbi:hypothetical protein [Paraglaciecola sp. 2405UD69-4]|uniref:hypothetical protein n=1 Tax=Paraglaciecola sp. 2405UD69-4 TaxID=3391836 RepID=UPI0039C948A0
MCSSVQAETITDKLIVALIEQNTPKVLYEETKQTWDFGTYDFLVNKAGVVSFSNAENGIRLTLPIEVIMQGEVNKDFLGQKVLLNCKSNFKTDTFLDVTLLLNPPSSTANVQISVPIPEVFLFCDGLKLPIQPFLQQLVAEKKAEWEQKIRSEIQVLLKQGGI